MSSRGRITLEHVPPELVSSIIRFVAQKDTAEWLLALLLSCKQVLYAWHTDEPLRLDVMQLRATDSDELMKMCISHGTFSMRKMVLARIIKQEDLSTTWEIAIRHNLHAEVAEMRLYENTRRDMCEDDVYNILRLCTEFGRFQIMKKFVRSHPVACVPFLRDDDHILSTACWFTAVFKTRTGQRIWCMTDQFSLVVVWSFCRFSFYRHKESLTVC